MQFMVVFEWILTFVVITISIIAILLVLLQSGKGGGSLFGDSGGGQQVIGSGKQGDLFSKLTSIFLGIFIGGSFLLAYLRFEISKPERGEKALREAINKKVEKSSPKKSPKSTESSSKTSTVQPKKAAKRKESPSEGDQNKAIKLKQPVVIEKSKTESENPTQPSKQN